MSYQVRGHLLHGPGSPLHNAYVESLNGKVHEDLLGIEIFITLLEAEIMAEDYRQNYNQNQHRSSLEYMTPHEFKKKLVLTIT